MGQATSLLKGSTITLVHSLNRADVEIPPVYEDLGTIPEAVYDTNLPDDYGAESVSIDWAYNLADMLNTVYPEDPTLIINELLSDPSLTDLDEITEEGLNKSSAMTMGLGSFKEIDTKGLEIIHNKTKFIQSSFLPDVEFPQMKQGISLIIPEPVFTYTLSSTISGSVNDMSDASTWLNIYLAVRGDELIQQDAADVDIPLVVDTVDSALPDLEVESLEADEDVPGASTGIQEKEGTIILPPNIIIQ